MHYESMYFNTSNCDPNLELLKSEMQNHVNAFTFTYASTLSCP